jgi:CheY-like chemotaxis protein
MSIDDTKGSILIAEDNLVMANVLRFNLERAGFQVTLARTGTEAIAAATTKAFDLVITDYQMPGANGEEVCHAVRSSPLNSGVPLVLCTAKGFELDGEQLKSHLQISALLSKPFSPVGVIRLVSDLLAAQTSHV